MNANLENQVLVSKWRRSIQAGLILVLIVVMLYIAYLFIGTIRAVYADQFGPVSDSIARVMPEIQQEASDALGDSFDVFEEHIVPAWDGGRANVLLLGVDQRPCEESGNISRTDTMILVSLDPETKSASMLSFPRDLWVNIPTVGPNRLNAAHFFGDAYAYPGGGPALIKRTIQENFYVPVHYYVRINFDGFRRVVDTLDGIELVVEEPIWDDHYPTDDCQYQTVQFDVGTHQVDGEQALMYARSRHYSSDFDRARRQQQVIFAIYDKTMSLTTLPRLPELWAAKGEAVQTDLSFLESMKLARLGTQIDRENIRHGVIDESMTVNITTDKGWQVLDWHRDQVAPLIEDLFGVSPDLSLETSDQDS